jgi:hypothetical protein
MTYYTYPITIEKEDGQYYAYSENLPGVYGLATPSTQPKPACSKESASTSSNCQNLPNAH